MKTIQARTMELKGTNYEIGFTLGSFSASVPQLKAFHTSGFPGGALYSPTRRYL